MPKMRASFVAALSSMHPNESINNAPGEGDGDRGPLDEGKRAASMSEPGEPVPGGPEGSAQERRAGAVQPPFVAAGGCEFWWQGSMIRACLQWCAQDVKEGL